MAPFPPEEGGMSAAPEPISKPACFAAKNRLASRLESELKRASASGRDLTLLLAALDAGASLAARSCNLRQLLLQARSSVSGREQAFEYDARTCALILPDLSLKQGVREAGALRKKLARVDWAGGRAASVCMGLTSRNGRPVGAARFLQEAASALQRAEKAGPGQIVAFQADPRKYREVLAGTEESQP